MQFPTVGADRPVRLALLAWAGVGLALTTYGVYDMHTYRCPSGECASPIGFVFALWGLAVLTVVTAVAAGRFAARRFRGSVND